MKYKVFIENFLFALIITTVIIISITLIELTSSLVKCYFFHGSEFIEVVNGCYRFR